MRIPSIKNGTSQKYDIYESGRRIGTVHSASLAAQIIAEVARRDAKAGGGMGGAVVNGAEKLTAAFAVDATTGAPDYAGHSGAHTPGPWFVSGVRFKMNGGEWHSINRYDEALKRDENIACVGYDPRTGVGMADARLIAAAPDLADCIHDLLYLHMAHHNHPLHVAARALLAKAGVVS